MKFDKASYGESINVITDEKWVKASIDGFIEEGEDPIDVLLKLKEKVNLFYKSENKAAKQETIDDKPSGITPGDIESCKQLVVLKIYEPLIKGNEVLTKAYNKRLKELA